MDMPQVARPVEAWACNGPSQSPPDTWVSIAPVPQSARACVSTNLSHQSMLSPVPQSSGAGAVCEPSTCPINSIAPRATSAPDECFLFEQLGIFVVPVMKLGLLIAHAPLYSAVFGCVELDGDVFSPMTYATFFGVSVAAFAIAATLLSAFLMAILSAPQVSPSTRAEIQQQWQETGLILAELFVVGCTYILAWMESVPLLQDPTTGRPVLVMRYLGWGASFPLLVDLDIRVAMRRPPGTPGMSAFCALFCVILGLWGQLTGLVVLRWSFIILSWLAFFVVLINIQRAKREGCEQFESRQVAKCLLTTMQLSYVLVGIFYHFALADIVSIDMEQLVSSVLDVIIKLLHCALVFEMTRLAHLSYLEQQEEKVMTLLSQVEVLILVLGSQGHILYANGQARAALCLGLPSGSSYFGDTIVPQLPQRSNGQGPEVLPRLCQYLCSHSSTSLQDSLNEVTETRRSKELKLELLSGLVVDGTVSPHFSEAGEVNGAVFSGRSMQPCLKPPRKSPFKKSLAALLNSMQGPAFAIEEPGHRVAAWNPAMQELCSRPQELVCLSELPFFDEESRATAEAALCGAQGWEENELQTDTVPHVLLSVPAASGGDARLLRMSCTRFGNPASFQSPGFVVVFCWVGCWGAGVVEDDAHHR